VAGRERTQRDLATLERLLSWAPAVIVATSLAGVVLGVTAVLHSRVEVRLMGALILLGSAVGALLASIACLCARVVVARWHGPSSSADLTLAATKRSAESHG
jgi:hypothetical protein